MGNRDIRRSVKGRGMGQGTWDIQDGHYRDFQEGKQGIWGSGFAAMAGFSQGSLPTFSKLRFQSLFVPF